MPTKAMFDFPQDVAIDDEGVLYVADGAGYAGEWYDDVSAGASATTIVVDEGDQERIDLSLAS